MQNYSPEDVQVYEGIRQALMAEKITSRDVWGMLKKGAFTPGTEALLHDIVDFGHYRAEEATASDRAGEYLAQYMAQKEIMGAQ